MNEYNIEFPENKNDSDIDIRIYGENNVYTFLLSPQQIEMLDSLVSIEGRDSRNQLMESHFRSLLDDASRAWMNEDEIGSYNFPSYEEDAEISLDQCISQEERHHV